MELINWFDKLPNQNLSHPVGGASVRKWKEEQARTCQHIIISRQSTPLFPHHRLLLPPPSPRAFVVTPYASCSLVVVALQGNVKGMGCVAAETDGWMVDVVGREMGARKTKQQREC